MGKLCTEMFTCLHYLVLFNVTIILNPVNLIFYLHKTDKGSFIKFGN